MLKLILRLACLFLILVIAAAAAVVQDYCLAFASDPECYPAVVRINSEAGEYEQITYARTLIQAIDEAEIPIGEHDYLNFPDDMLLQPGESYSVHVVRLDRVRLNWSGFEISTAGACSSMPELISRAGFSDLDLSDGSRIVNPPAESDQGDVVLTYVDVDKKVVRIYEEIPFSTITVDDPNVYIGKSVIRTEGKVGERALVFEETYENGILVRSEQTGIEIIREPVQKVIGKGTKVRVVYAPINRKTLTVTVLKSFSKISGLLKPNGNLNYESFKDNGNGTITVDGHTFKYSAMKKRTITMFDGLECCLQKGCHLPPINHKTFSGVPAQRGLVATHGMKVNGVYTGSLLPMGTVLFVEGYGLGVVADIHGAKNNPELIDACYNAGEIRAGIANFGKMYSRVYILTLP